LFYLKAFIEISFFTFHSFSPSKSAQVLGSAIFKFVSIKDLFKKDDKQYKGFLQDMGLLVVKK
jgi:hypothetical protein